MLRFNYDEEAQLLRPLGASAAVGEAGFTSLERLWLRPTLEVVGMGSGFQGEGIKTIVPRRAFAKLAARLVPDQTPKEVRRGWQDGRAELTGRCTALVSALPAGRNTARPAGAAPIGRPPPPHHHHRRTDCGAD